MSTPILASQQFGEGPPLIILHGLFGSGDNWRSISNVIREIFSVFLIDLRNHGQSFWDDDVSYEAMASDVYQWMQAHNLEQAHVLGHSMGGKVAMQLMSDFPHCVRSLLVADIAPKAYLPHHDDIFMGLNAVRDANASNRRDADSIMAQHISNAAVRQFLLKSYAKDPKGDYDWIFNLTALYKGYEAVLAAPKLNASLAPVVFIRGGQSDYILDADVADMKALYPNLILHTMPQAGHWLHVEDKALFLDYVLRSLA